MVQHRRRNIRQLLVQLRRLLLLLQGLIILAILLQLLLRESVHIWVVLLLLGVLLD